MQKLKILLWSPKGAGNHYYGPGKNALSLYREIKRLVDINVVLVHAYPNHENLNAFDVMHEIGDYRKSNLFSFLKYLIEASKVLFKYRNKGYIFHGLDVYSNIFIPSLIAKFLGYPVALKIAAHPSGLSVSKSKLILFLRRLTAGVIDKFFAISFEIVDELTALKIKKEKIALVFNGVLMPNQINDKKIFTGSTPYTLLFTGALVERKRPHILIEAIAKSRNPSAWALKLIGPEQNLSYLDQMKQSAEDYGLDGQIEFLGFKDDLTQFYLGADLYALPSLSEGMPNGVLEAMVYQLPLIISNFSIANLLCDNDNGYIADTVEEIANALDTFVENPNYMKIKGLKSFELINQKFNLSKVAKSYIDAFNEISS